MHKAMFHPAGTPAVRLLITKSEAGRLGRLEEWERVSIRNQKRAALKARLPALVDQALAIAKQHGWSERKLCQKLQMHRVEFRRMRYQKLNLSVRIAKMESAIQRLKV
jgi:hypothetical protein